MNGTILYSPSLLPSKSLITARGQHLDFFQNDTGTYISSGNVTANVLRTDVITSNGQCLFPAPACGPTLWTVG